MKTEILGLPASVATIGVIYAVALAAAPETGQSAQTDPAQTDRTALFESQTALLGSGVAASLLDRTIAIEPSQPRADPRPSLALDTCPYTSNKAIAFAVLMQAHHRLPNRPAETPDISRPTRGKAKLTVF